MCVCVCARALLLLDLLFCICTLSSRRLRRRTPNSQQKLGLGGVSRLAKQISAACTGAANQITDRIQPATQALLLRLSDLRGLSKWGARFGRVGLDPATLDAAIAEVGHPPCCGAAHEILFKNTVVQN